MRDYVLTALIFGSLPVCLYRPWLGFVIWYWFGLMCPHRMTWDFAYSMPFAAYIGGATLIGTVFAKDRKPIPWNRELVLIVILLAYFTFTTFFAWAPQNAWPQLEKVFKVILMTVLSTMFIYGRKRITVIMYTIALSLGFFGVKGAIFVVTSGGAGQVKGPEGSFLDGNTFVGVAMIMVLPLILHLARDDHRPWVKRSLHVMFAMTIIATIFTTSRGAYLGLAAVLPLMFMGARRRWIAVVAIAVALVGAQFLPDHIFRRAETIENYQQDGSANQRLQSWTVAWNVAKDYPLTGAGFEFEYEGDDARWLSYGDRQYDWAIKNSSAAHSIYFQVLGQHGFIAFGLYLVLLIGTLLKLGRIAKAAKTRAGMTWLASYATALQIALVGYMVSGAFLSLAYFDLAFLYYVLTAVFARELKGDEKTLAATATSTQVQNVSPEPQRSR